MKNLNPAGRIIFALSFNKSRLEATYFPSPIDNVLISYFYIHRPTSKAKGVSLDLVERIRKHSKLVFIDSGIFSLKVKHLKVTVATKTVALPADYVHKLITEARKKMPMFVDFAKAYVAWLSRHDDLYDWAFDLDVDEFLGLEVAEKFYAYLRNRVKNPRKIIRVWHGYTRTYEDWVKWCESGEYDYLAIEGGQHNKNYDFYRRMIKKAHEHNIKVHILAATDLDFLKNVPCDTGDSSSWMSGSRYGYIYTPHGRVSFGEKHTPSMPHWDLMTAHKRAEVTKWLKSHGLETDGEILKTSWEAREMANIAYFLENDKPYQADGQVFRRGFLPE